MPNGQHCNKHFNFMSDVVHHITMDHVGGPGKISLKSQTKIKAILSKSKTKN